MADKKEVTYAVFEDDGIRVKGVKEDEPAAVYNVEGQVVFVSVSQWRGSMSVDFRQVWNPPNEAGDVFVRTKKGARIPIEELDGLIEFLLACKEHPMVKAYMASIAKMKAIPRYEPKE